MAQTYQAVYLGDGDRIPYTPSGAAVASGDVVVQNSLAGLATQPIADGVLGSLGVNGLYRVVKINGGINAGQAVYWDADGDPQGGVGGSGGATTTATANTFLGMAAIVAGASDETVDVRVFAVPITLQGLLSNPIVDPGDAGAIPVTVSGYVPIVTAGAETRTLAEPTFVGQELLLYMKTDEGDCVITCATGINQAVNTTITMADAGDVIKLVAIQLVALRWRTVVNDGCALA